MRIYCTIHNDRLYGEVTEIRFDRFFEMLTPDEIPEIENKYLNMVWHSANRESRKTAILFSRNMRSRRFCIE